MNSLVDQSKPLAEQNENLMKIVHALMDRVEKDTGSNAAAYAQFERAVLLEDQVRARTSELEEALSLLNASNVKLESARSDMLNAIEAIEEGFALFDDKNMLVMTNSRFCSALPDVKSKLEPKASLERFVRLVAHSDNLVLPADTSTGEWAASRLAHHQKLHTVFNVAIKGDLWWQVSSHRTDDGSTVIMQTDVTDIIRTERLERDKLLDDQARMIKATLDHLNQAVAIFDRNLHLIGWNQSLSSFLSLNRKRISMGSSFSRMVETLQTSFGPENRDSLTLLEVWVAKATKKRALSFELTSKGGQIFDAFVRSMPDNGFVISLSDVSAERTAARLLEKSNETLEMRVSERTWELQDALDSAKRANASKTRFVAAASHDLLQPLSAAKLYLAAIEGDKNVETINKVERALGSVENILEDLLEISKLDSGAASLELCIFPISTILDSLIEDFSPIAAQKNLELRYVRSDLIVHSDPSYLRRILQNLISNAIRYTDQGRVLIGVRRNGGSARIEVWDTGHGITEADQTIIFDEFQRLEAKASASEGMGLGLAIVERACAQLNHQIQVWSVLGTGSGFFVNVPISHEKYTQTKTTQIPDADFTRLKDQNLIVLLVENDVLLRRALTTILEKWGITVLGADGSETVYDLIDELGIVPDAMIVDYQLDDGVDGAELARQLSDKHPQIATRIISANRSAELRQKCREAKFELLLKPVDPQRLVEFLLSIGD
jgi:signal transduction histidine kinase/CheY-like chemotaxis protein